ncbi:MAG: HdeA/HdeB family chaperone [Pseudorhodoplanes sp.]
MRKATYPFVLTIALLPVSGGTAFAQGERNRNIDQYACKDVMRDSGANRDVAIAFLHGYLLGKSAGANFSLDKIQRETDAFIERCLDNPNEKAVDAMTAVKR